MVNLSDNKLNSLLSEKEREELKILNDKSNVIRNSITNKNDLLNNSIRNISKKWANTNIDILVDIVKFFSQIKKYSNYFDDIDETGQWFTGIYTILYDFVKIFTKKDRSIYIGLSFIMISFALYLIQITS
tara:strand:- start:3357 stop:3746 length:390 start_codon:yes stop_codon:yes gene_type:complete